MTRVTFLGVVALIGVFMSAGSPSVVLADGNRHSRTYEVTVTNITTGLEGASGQILNGLVVATHNRHFRLFELGQPVSDELAMVAEDALTAELVAALSANRDVCDFQTIGGPIVPGDSASLPIKAKGSCRFVSVAAMLVTTNDAFAALNGVRLPRWSNGFLALAYDAGSEANTENCDDIPGPPCGVINRVGGGEGYVSIHSGIHGVAGGVETSNLNPSKRDWRNPVARVMIRRIK